MLQPLDDIEARIIGCLIEKSIVTPDQYPLTLNGLTNACNQKSARSPVMALQQGEVQHTLRVLEAKHLVQMEENFKSRTEKYLQRFCNTRYSDLNFDPAELAVVCLLLLRGPQTPGELRARSGRLHAFADNAEVLAALKRLMVRRRRPAARRTAAYAGSQGLRVHAPVLRSGRPRSTRKSGTGGEARRVFRASECCRVGGAGESARG